jgi:hypothetical protein
VKHKRGRIRRVKHWKTAMTILAVLLASIALAEDFKTINGKEYKNVEVGRVEPDGLVLWSKSGILKVYFSELPKEVVDKWLPPEVKERVAAEEKRIAAEKAAEEKRIQEQKAAERERAEKEKNAEADLKRVIDQFQAAEQRASQAYQNAPKGTLVGQVFVSSRGGENFKLGAVEVALFARDAIDVLLAGLKTNADIKIQQLRAPVDSAKTAYEQADAAERAAFDEHLKSALNADSERAWNVAKEARDKASDQYFEMRRELNRYYSGAFYFGFLGFPIQTAETDADGKFVIQVPQSGGFVIAAQAKRSVGDDTEHYYWVQPISLEGQQQLTQNLSNNNLTSTTGTSSLVNTQD